jgi:hypothetical protein
VSPTRRPEELGEIWPGVESSSATSEIDFFFFVRAPELLRGAPEGENKKKYENNRRTRRHDADPYAATVSAASGHT